VESAVLTLEDTDSLSSKVNVDFNVEVDSLEPADVDRIVDKIAEGNVDELSGGEIRSLIRIVDNNDSFPEKTTFGVGGWEDLGKQIAERREERDDIITREEWEKFADLPDEEVSKRLEEQRSKREEYTHSNDDE